MQGRKPPRGFVLVEVLIALAILAIAMAAIIGAIAQSIDTTAALRDRNVAMWVAQDRLVFHRMRRDWPATRTTTGTREMAGYTWRWQQVVITTPVAELRRIEIEVREGERPDVLARLVGFLRDPGVKP
ncbi:MAG: type II secretion system minor pseudopilin GspI [Acidiferrobacterales bacterium]